MIEVKRKQALICSAAMAIMNRLFKKQKCVNIARNYRTTTHAHERTQKLNRAWKFIRQYLSPIVSKIFFQPFADLLQAFFHSPVLTWT
ncbi:MAG: hypothetical protein SD837_11030 [Candidatus Electrothrix scaldis]|nr:MAG: hypothetical protein SD837_11030 [Candidatus Electrothrix sp. GW3-3]